MCDYYYIASCKGFGVNLWFCKKPLHTFRKVVIIIGYTTKHAHVYKNTRECKYCMCVYTRVLLKKPTRVWFTPRVSYAWTV